MHRILFSIGNYPIYSFGVMVALGCIAASYIAAMQAKLLGIDRDDTLEACVWVVAFAVIGARLGFVIQNLGFFGPHPAEIFNFRGGGMSWHGSIAGIILGAWIPTRRMGIRLLDFLDLLAPAMLLGLGIGRIGCFLNGCCYGKVTDAWWAIAMPTENNPTVILPRYPTQLLEMGLALFVGVPILFYWLRRRRFRGEVFVGFVLIYSIIRFTVEFFREGALLGNTPLTLAQWVSVGLVLLSVALLLVGRGRGSDPATLNRASERVADESTETASA
jgi:phosphatidylglycerol:prolipoprotein diacylglycerol transferase